MSAFVQLYFASLREWRRDATALLWSILFPTILALVVGVVFSSSGKMFFRVGLVNEVGNAEQPLIDGFKQHEAFQITEGTRQDELDALKHGRRDAVLILTTGNSEPEIYIDATSPNGQSAASLIGQMITTIEAETQPETDLYIHNISSKRLSTADYMLPGVLGMALMLLGLYVTAIPLVSLREKEILRRMGITPLTRFTLLASQFAFRLTVALIQALVVIAISVVVFDLPLQISRLPLTIGLVLLGGGVFITLGYVLSALSKTEEAVQVGVGLIFLVFSILSGAFVPFWRIPNAIRPLVDAIPLTYLADALRHSMTGANAVHAMTTNVLVLVIWWIGCAVVALRFFRWESAA